MNLASPRQPPFACTLRVVGLLDSRWAGWFDGFILTSEPDGTTTITGVVADQTQLHGLIAKIRDLGIALTSLETRPPTTGPGDLLR